MVQVTNEELWAWNVLNNAVANAQGELQRAVAARDDYLAKLERKYNARFDRESGRFISKDGDEGKARAEVELKHKRGAKL